MLIPPQTRPEGTPSLSPRKSDTLFRSPTIHWSSGQILTVITAAATTTTHIAEFLRNKPVFVFDSSMPTLKRRTVIARCRQHENAQAKICKMAEKLLLNHVSPMLIPPQTGPEGTPSLSPRKSDTLFRSPTIHWSSGQILTVITVAATTTTHIAEFLRNKPIFVFDSGMPTLKRRTVIARCRQHENAQAKICKIAEKLLLNHADV
ncbi:hypothetical protein Acr_27g0002010 [Actinidia rufa]|uniref:Uncharacterized protein n=1 Tax=Actinidia rufa TaxID=165716 RepID=A0A7J0H5V8_9ERIC|nr:hypothetical protein Acr_27g0002010 [Actinidia rufa]